MRKRRENEWKDGERGEEEEEGEGERERLRRSGREERKINERVL